MKAIGTKTAHSRERGRDDREADLLRCRVDAASRGASPRSMCR